MDILKFVSKYINKGKLSVYIMLSLITWGISMYLPLINGSLIDILTNRNFQMNIKKLLLTITLLSILRIVLTYFLSVINVKLSTKTTFEINFHVLDHVKKLPVFFFHKQNSAYLNQRIYTDSTAVSDFSINDIKNLTINALSLLISSVILIRINLKITLVLLILIPAYIGLYFFFKKKLYILNFNCKESQNKYFGEINSQLENIRFIKFNSLFSIMNNNLNDKFSLVFKDVLKLVKVSSLFSNTGMLVTVLANILILILGVQQILNGELTIGQFTVIGTYFNTIISGIEYCLSFLENYQKSLVSYNRIKELLILNKETNGKKIVKSIENISVKGLAFRYVGGNNIFSDLHYEFKKGFIYRIKGENGKGKSSIINIILGLYNGEYEGTVQYNGLDILNLDMYKTREKLIGVVEQEPTLLKESILNNITYNLEGYDSNKLKSLIEELKLDKFISKLEYGINTNIAENSYNISGGEKQKISIIRTLLKNPDVVVLDEASSALDFDSARQLSLLLKREKENKIIILVSHSNVLDSIVDFEIALGS